MTKFKNKAEIALIMGLSKRVFYSKEEFERSIIAPLNALNEPPDFYQWKHTPKFVVVKCRLCNTFSVWYIFRQTADG